MTDGSSTESTAAIDFGEAVVLFRERAESEAEGYRRLAEQLSNPSDQVMVDVGCGAAGMALALAQTRPGSKVIAVDSEAAMIELARERAAETGVEITTALADTDDPESLAAAIDRPADLIWARGVLHHAADPQAALANLTGLLAPGGRLAIEEGGLAPQYLPWNLGVGRPGLELRLAEAGSRRLEAEAAEHGGTPLTYGWNVAMERAGLVEIREVHEAVALPAPLQGQELDQALKSLGARFDWFQDYLDAEDQSSWETLLDRDSPHWLGSRRDLHRLGIRTVYVGLNR